MINDSLFYDIWDVIGIRNWVEVEKGSTRSRHNGQRGEVDNEGESGRERERRKRGRKWVREGETCREKSAEKYISTSSFREHALKTKHFRFLQSTSSLIEISIN